jgi:hypothetical protein
MPSEHFTAHNEASHQQATSSSEPVYSERLVVPWWCWPVLLIGLSATLQVIVVLGPQLSTRAGWPAAIITFLVSVAISAALLVWAGARTITVADGELRVAGSRLPFRAMGDVTATDPETTRALLGRDANVRAYLCIRGWIRTAVKIEVNDPEDDTPYWLISTRRPEKLAAVLTRGRDADRA